MPKLRALLWDDQPDRVSKKILGRIISKLEDFDISVSTTRDQIRCIRKFEEAPAEWDLLILDVVDSSEGEGESEVEERAGVKLASRLRRVRGDIPIVFLTSSESFVLNGEADALFDEPRFTRHKRAPPSQIAVDIVQFARRATQEFNFRRVFLIHGHGLQCEGLLEEVEHDLQSKGVEVDKVTPERETTPITKAVVDRMSKAGLFIAICSPDEELKKTGEFIPRPNVLLEIGLALGLPNGTKRLVILQRWGSEAKTKAVLPSDLDGVLTKRFFADRRSLFSELLEMLRERGLKV